MKRKTREEMAEEIVRLSRVVHEAVGVYRTTIKWNESMEKIIGRVPLTGISISALGDALQKAGYLKKKK